MPTPTLDAELEDSFRIYAGEIFAIRLNSNEASFNALRTDGRFRDLLTDYLASLLNQNARSGAGILGHKASTDGQAIAQTKVASSQLHWQGALIDYSGL